MKPMDWLYRLCRWTLGGIFIYAGGTKLLEPELFAVLIEAYGIVPEGWLMPAAIGLPFLEVIAGLGLLFDIRGSLALIFGLLVFFMAILAYGIWMGLDVDCGCFGPEDPEAQAFHGLRLSLFRDLVMMAGVFFIYGYRRYHAIGPANIMVMGSNQSKGEKRMRVDKTVLKLFLALCLVAGVAAPAGAFLDSKFQKEVEKEAGAVKLVREVQRGSYDVVTTEELKKWIDSGKEMLIVDTMPYEDSYKKQHVPGAVQFLFPIPDMKEWDIKETDGKTLEDFTKLLGSDKDKLIVVYCGFVKCTRSHNGAAWAVKLGYKNVYRHPGGIFAWKGATFPVEKAE